MGFKTFAGKFFQRNKSFGRLTTRDAVAFDVDASGNPRINLGLINSVGLHNLVDIEVYNLTNTLGFSSHYVKFKCGGEVSFAYNTSGQLIEFSFNEVLVTISKNNEILFKSFTRVAHE